MKTIRQQKMGSKPVIIFHGDKGGVGKSWACSVFTDWLVKKQIPVALIDGDIRNPDVSRMFGDSIPVSNANLREHDGWMDLIDFMMANQEKVIVISMPAGIGSELIKEANRFGNTVQMLQRPVSMFWVINRLPDSVNLLNSALASIGKYLQSKFVVKNLFFGETEKFTRWDLSKTRAEFEKSGGLTVELTELHERTVDKLYADNDNIIPFSAAVMPVNETVKSLHGLTPSENMELICWLKDNYEMFDTLRSTLGI